MEYAIRPQQIAMMCDYLVDTESFWNGASMESPSRRSVLAAVAATVTLPVIQAAIGRMRSLQAAAPAAAATAAATATSTAPAGWFSTTLKAADLKDNEVVVVPGHKVLLTRSGKTVLAMTSVCTHKQGALKPKANDPKVAWCPLHMSEFSLTGSVTKGPAKLPLQVYAIRLDDKGVVEVDPTQKPAKTDKDASLTLS
jgi:Rieske Fe-S protein